MTSVWERLAKLSVDERKKYLTRKRTQKNRGKVTKSGTASNLYTKLEIQAPETDAKLMWEADWGDDD